MSPSKWLGAAIIFAAFIIAAKSQAETNAITPDSLQDLTHTRHTQSISAIE